MSTRRKDERGLTLVLVSLTLVVMLVFAAFAIDIGNGYNQRRQAQSAADAAALAAAQDNTLSAAVATAIAVSRVNLANPPSDATWQALWAPGRCTDPDRVARGFTVTTATTNCVSFTSNRQRVRVYLPNIEASTYFGGVVGVDTLRVSAFAEAQINVVASGDVLPYALTPVGAAGDSEICLKIGPALSASGLGYPYNGCDAASTSGNFQKLDVAIYGNYATGLQGSQYCGSGSAGTAGAINTAAGVDHPLSLHPNGIESSGYVDDQASCPNFLAEPNRLRTQTGNANEPINAGFYGDDVGNVSGLRGRLAQSSPYSGQNVSVRTGGLSMDNVPLWTFIRTGRTDIPAACKRETFDDSLSDAQLAGYGVASPIPWRTAPYGAFVVNESKAHMFICMEQFKAAYGDTHESGEPILFDLDTDGDANNRHYDIMDDPRFGFVPLFWTNFSGGTDYLLIQRFTPVWIQTLYFQCNATSCNGIFNPGYDSSGSNSALENTGWPIDRDVDATSAFLLRDSMLPVEIIEDAPGNQQSIDYQLIR